MKSHSKLAAGLCLLAGLVTAGTVAARDHEDALALGDSVVFGFITQAGYEYVNPDNFIGYPEYLDVFDDLDFANAACPGETTGSFLSSTAPDNGCRYFRSLAPLHVAYGSTQFNFAKDFLSHHRQVRLVTIGLGANDLTLLENSCAAAANPTQCYRLGLPGVLQTIAANMATILADLRATGFGGVIVIVNYYSLDYSDPVGTAVTGYLNEAISTPASAYGAVIADVFSAFQKVASTPPAGGKTCAAGLLNASPQNQFVCDVHPSQSGQRLIARTVARAFAAGHY